jgi:hypothetical protein
VILIPHNATDEQVLEIIRKCLDVLAAEDYESLAAEVGFSRSFDEPKAECLRGQIKAYRSPKYFPDVTDFVVTNWRNAQGGNPKPRQCVIWYKPNDLKMRGAVDVDLPLNGKWSDLTAHFVFFERTSEGSELALEDIYSESQSDREQEAQ